MPIVSVIIPTFNRSNLIGEAIQSVLDQTFSDLELIVVDDGSTDNTEDVIQSFRDPRLKFLKRSHTGPSATRNAGIHASIGEFIAFLDSDDRFLPNKLSLQMAKVDDLPHTGLVYGRYLSDTGLQESPIPIGRCNQRLELRELLLGPVFHWSTVLIRREWLNLIGGFDEAFVRGEDWELTLRLALAGCQMACVPQPITVVGKHLVSNMRDEYNHISALQSVLDKIFDDPRMPLEMQDIKPKAYATQLIRIACTAYLASDPVLGKELLERALLKDPTLVKENVEILTDTFVYLIKGLSMDDPLLTIQRIVDTIPEERPFSKKLKHQLLGKFYLIMAFQTYQQGRIKASKAYAIHALIYTPSNFRNRGLLSILLRSIIGGRFFYRLKRMQTIY